MIDQPPILVRIVVAVSRHEEDHRHLPGHPLRTENVNILAIVKRARETIAFNPKVPVRSIPAPDRGPVIQCQTSCRQPCRHHHKYRQQDMPFSCHIAAILQLFQACKSDGAQTSRPILNARTANFYR